MAAVASHGVGIPGLGSWPARRARITPEALAFVEDGHTLTYGGLADRVMATGPPRRPPHLLAGTGPRAGAEPA